MSHAVCYERSESGHVAVLRINRPNASNAVNSAVMEGIAESLELARLDHDVHAVILTGTGERSFIAGGDLKEFHDELKSEDKVYQKMSQMRAVLEQMIQFEKPIIAAINGAARGGGGEVAAACHFRIAAESATVGFVQVKLGISPGWGGGILLQRIVGRQKAMRLLLSGEVIDAKTAHLLGFFDVVVPTNELLSCALAFADILASNSSHAVQGILKLLKGSESLPLTEAMERESRLCAELWMTDEHHKYVEAFEQRKKDR